MARIPECLIKPDAARALKALAPYLNISHGDFGFLCPACEKPVQPIGDHFEHLRANPDCPLVQERKRQKRDRNEVTNDR